MCHFFFLNFQFSRTISELGELALIQKWAQHQMVHHGGKFYQFSSDGRTPVPLRAAQVHYSTCVQCVVAQRPTSESMHEPPCMNISYRKSKNGVEHLVLDLASQWSPRFRCILVY